MIIYLGLLYKNYNKVEKTQRAYRVMEKSNYVSFLAGAAIASAYFLYKSLPKKEENNTPECSISDPQSPQYLQLKQEQLARVIKYFGEEKFSKMENSSVAVFGVGGVGSHVVNMLARSGVKRIKIVDFDRVSLSSLNRHSFALRKDVGIPKVECLKKYIKEILPHIIIETVEKYVTVQNASQLLSGNIDYVVDCIDNMDAKVELVRLCKERNIKLIVSGGAGMKCDPTRLQIRDISQCKYDTLIVRLRRQLGKKGIKNGIKVAFSYQQAEKELLPLNKQQEESPQDFKVFDNYRIRIIPVIGTMPAILGMTIASYVLCELAGEPYEPHETDYVKSTAVNRVYCQFINDQKRMGVSLDDMLVDIQEISILVKAVYKWKSVISEKKYPHSRIVKWQKSKPASLDNLAYMGKEEYEKHITFNSLQEAKYSKQILSRFAERTKKAIELYQKGFMMFL